MNKGWQSQQSSSHTLIFIHIPKAAGTTFAQVLVRQYKHQDIHYVNIEAGPAEQHSVNVFRELPEQVKAQMSCVWGHIPFGLHQWLPQAVRYLAIMRNPVERVVSYYYHVCHHRRHPLHSEVVKRDMSLEDFIRKVVDINENNLETRFISGCANFDSLMPPHDELPANALDLAKKNLENYFAVCGLTEQFDESLLLMQRVLGWKSIFYKKKNVGKKPSAAQLSSSTRRLIEKYEEKDLELHEFTRNRLAEMLDAYGVGEKQVQRFRTLNSFIGTPRWICDGLRRKLVIGASR